MTYEEFKKRYSYDPKSDKLGAGGFGKVFKAYDNVRDRWVAIKVAEVQPEHESIRLSKEVELAGKLPPHPNIAHYEDCYTFDIGLGEHDFGIMQYYPEGDLLKLLRTNSITQVQKISILTQILNGLEFLHDNGVIHRDLKPQNILMVRRGEEYIPKITDFGISKQVDIAQSSVFGNSVLGGGTISYASPEQLRSNTIRKNTDLWSFGVIAYQMFVGYLPFNTGNHASTSEAGRSELVRQAVAGVLPDTVGGIPEPWQTLIRRCLNADPERRVRNAAQCRDILAENSNNNQSGTASDRSSHFSDFTDENDETIRDIGITPKANPEPKPEPPKPQPEKKRKRSKLSLMLGLGIPLGIVLTYILSFVILSVFENYVFSWQSNNTPTEVTVIEPAFVLVEGGTFWMGSTDNGAYADEAPIHSVTLSSFYIGKYEVTQAEWKAIMGSNPSHFKGDNLPVESVSWNDVQEFITRLSSATGKHYRLPTEAEWEFAARGGNQSRDYTYAGSNNIDGVAWYSGNSSNKTHAVGTKSSNELGIYDMSGNVWEWCSDWYGSYSAAQQTNPTGPAGTNRVLRGGSLADDAQICRSAYRFSYSPSYGLSFLGFRLVFVP